MIEVKECSMVVVCFELDVMDCGVDRCEKFLGRGLVL
jgi:hypothetical protein